MYAWQRMTDAQRAQVLAERKQMLRPWHAPPHPNFGEGWYLITAATFQHRQLFAAPNELSALESRLREFLADAKLSLAAWVILPNHYHALIHAKEATLFSPIAKRLHGRSAQYANRRDKSPGRKVWFQFSDRQIRNERHFWTSLHYIIFNPQKHGFAENFRQWPWSCCDSLREMHGDEWIRNLQEDYPLRDYGAKWDAFHTDKEQ